MKRLALLLLACTPKPQPATVSVAATASATSTTAAATASASATAAAPSFDLTTCGATPGCMWSAGWQSACSGVAVGPAGTGQKATQVCVCNGCLSDADCKAKPGGRCETFPRMCFPAAKACTYPGDLCAKNGEACEKIMSTQSGPAMHKACYHDGSGHVACGPFQWPPP